MVDEFELIERFFESPAEPGDGVWLGIGDDAAVLDVPSGSVVVDEMACHPIPAEADGFTFGSFAIGDALARIRKTGAEPQWFTLALTLPEVNETWLEGFSRAIREAERRERVRLVGGDTTRGPGALAVCVYAVRAEGAPERNEAADAAPRTAAEEG